jgi:uncharacterized damage-inducible protein DinB
MDTHQSQESDELQIAALFLSFSCTKLDQMTGHLAACLGRLSDAQIWQRGGAHENAIGNLVLHLCGNMRQWIMHGVGGQPDVRTRDLEFSATTGHSGAELMRLFRSTVSEATKIIAATTPARLIERTTPQGRDVTVLDAIYLVVGHVQQHVGQIILLTKQMTAQDLDLTIPRPR